MSARTDLIDFAAVMGAEGVPGDVIADVVRDAKTLHRLAEFDCNVGLDNDGEKRETFAKARISGRLAAYGIIAEYQGDPRGAVVKLRLPSGKSNDWGGEGLYCVPTQA